MGHLLKKCSSALVWLPQLVSSTDFQHCPPCACEEWQAELRSVRTAGRLEHEHREQQRRLFADVECRVSGLFVFVGWYRLSPLVPFWQGVFR
jgi:hypothetical protein